jgi:hypothetical protein
VVEWSRTLLAGRIETTTKQNYFDYLVVSIPSYSTTGIFLNQMPPAVDMNDLAGDVGRAGEQK